MSDEKAAIRFTAAAAVIRLTTIKEGRRKKTHAPAPNAKKL
jgi:hypothetical protein